jgi:hypothetical protein
MRLHVALNGTNENPYTKFGLTQNPFPQIASFETQTACLHLQKLGADPIPNAHAIREHLRGWGTEFVDLCCRMFVKGQYVTFDVEWEK